MAWKKKNPMKGKKKGMDGLMALLVALAIAAPAPVFASSLTYGLDTIPTRVTAGYRLISGPSDPGEALSIDLNNVLSALSTEARLQGLVVKWGDERILELGVLSGGYGGQAGADATTGTENQPFLGAGGWILEVLKVDAIVMRNRAEATPNDPNPNRFAFGVFAGLDVAQAGPKLVSVVTAGWAW